MEKRNTTCAIEEAVSCLNSIVDRVCASRLVDFPEAEADDGHGVAIVELDGWGSHDGGNEVA